MPCKITVCSLAITTDALSFPPPYLPSLVLSHTPFLSDKVFST